MVDYNWGDAWFEMYGHDLTQAMIFITKEAEYRGGIPVFLKEKYGTIRYEFIESAFWPSCWPIYNHVYPGYMYYQWPKVFMKLEPLAKQLLDVTGLTSFFHKKQCRILRDVVLEAAQRWPHLRDEILEDICVHECIMGETLHNEYWR